MTKRGCRRITLATFLLALLAGGPAKGLTVQAEQDPWALAAALAAAGGGLQLTGVSLRGHSEQIVDPQGSPPSTIVSSGVFTNPSGTYGIGAGVVLSTGDVHDYGDGPDLSGTNTGRFFEPALPYQSAWASSVTGEPDLSYYDVTQLDLAFVLSAGFDRIELDLVFGSEEWPEFVNSRFIDGFGLFLDGINVAYVGGLPIDVDHPAMAPLPGTELDAVLAPGADPLLRFGFTLSEPGASHTLTFLVFDTSDFRLDTTVYLSGLSARSSIQPVPEPAAALLLLGGLATLAARRRPPRLRARGRRPGRPRSVPKPSEVEPSGGRSEQVG
jgi:hypothetical protein